MTKPNHEEKSWKRVAAKDFDEKNTIKAEGSTVRAQNVDWVMDGWSG